ncbi:uncharacterized protein TM35_000122860 [Trypanosoma theileri]|uniref:Surface protein TolT n=1 Tax=Trypanosoma theileri TaxID=67003 RepID=A0A1X0NY14_9TRYP|nr:uncharacterized protein TM35_000122860 [Trypanosoma theileri]ORC89511.1 hypothetical protein TM35_000122860 [Trypanosoma theileri]
MTTMFVQLRRVVYLLVLLQCCVCVAYAEDTKESAQDVVSRKENSLKEVEGMMDATLKEALQNISELDSKLKLWKEHAELAKSAANEVTQMRQVIEAAIRKNNDVPVESKGAVGDSLTEELLKSASEAVKNTQVAVKNARSSASAAKELGKSCYDAYDKLNSLVWAHRAALTRYTSAIDEAGLNEPKMTEKRKIADESKQKQQKAHDVVPSVIDAGKKCLLSERETNLQAVHAERAMRKLETVINQVEAIIGISSTLTPEKVPGADSRASITQSSDSSSSPALVHSPLLLLLVLMCVLGCTAVF